ncbi:hypothetical protein [Paenibacillus sp. Cedars]|uniref:hypothetical protein n=1 Tax=Paenibacillus sp. Cedars TaxID=1980674 RepID=UPI00116384B4|nr:hypothetical protein [Paenibacillus sp. Cedars]AWP28121.1 hypothetical protein B9D94_16530 [Paenibacillus sp. Cedars]
MSSKRVRKSRTVPKSVPASQHWVGQPVVVVLKDGSYYIGELSQIEGQAVTLSGLRANNKMPASIARSGDKAQISGFLSALFGGPPSGPVAEGAVEGEAVAAGGGGGGFGFLGQIVPHIKLGMNVIKTIMPLMGMLKI